ncbi:MAG: hypothetical protein COA80_08630 [Leeuwenhoekiella sp.]|nr:MAG: hypothetical protein COA80_08630 [Leeuwenhoekiella sp.]
MNLVILKNQKENNLSTFIESWSKLYSYANEAVYKKAISQSELFDADLQDLYKWKNGMRLSVKKQNSLETKIISKLSLINTLRDSTMLEVEEFRKEFKDLSTVWKIFLLHIIKPSKFPIYDQHIHRTFLFIHNEDWSNISNTSISNKAKEAFYFNRYLPFIEEQQIKDLKQLDEAFFAFGQFLNTGSYSSLVTNLIDKN